MYQKVNVVIDGKDYGEYVIGKFDEFCPQQGQNHFIKLTATAAKKVRDEKPEKVFLSFISNEGGSSFSGSWQPLLAPRGTSDAWIEHEILGTFTGGNCYTSSYRMSMSA